MKMRSWMAAACVACWMMACGGSKPPAEAPSAGDAKPATDAPKAELESGPMAVEGEGEVSENPAIQQELPCPGKNAKYYDTGMVKSEVLTGDCELNGASYKAGTLLEFDENGQLVAPN